MKIALWIASMALVLLAGYNLGLQASRAACQAQISQYQRLYVQAITWQDWTIANLPHITRDSRLKDKEN